ncbi:S41 family peptidase [Flavobacteriaceae bacterium]|nr:S41 family peptidase [Flavobacteriaceae bacterium]
MKNVRKFSYKFMLISLVGLVGLSCYEDLDDNGAFASEINDFVWKGMNLAYLYKDNISDLSNNRFSSDSDYSNYLNSYETPEYLFENLIFERENIDKYSQIVDDYIELQQYFEGVSNGNGMEYGLRYVPGSNFNIYGYVRYVHPGSVANENNIKRGDIFSGINGSSLNIENYPTLLSTDSYTVNFANYFNNNTTDIIDDTVVSNNINIDLYKVSIEKNPIFHSTIIENSDGKSGYLLYNQFTSTFDDELNEVFSNFKSNNIDNLILDLRYNSGGSVNSALLISSLITGQFTNEVFSTEQWNNEIQNYWLNNDPEYLINRFIGSPNSLNLNKVIIITSRSSASASELVINCLKPYIDVIQVGTTTYGKYQASVTLYDSPDFSLNGVNPSHIYALQPLVLKTLNSLGETDYYNGLSPNIIADEDSSNLGIIGDINEPLLSLALGQITSDRSYYVYTEELDLVSDSNSFDILDKEMYFFLDNYTKFEESNERKK